LALAAVYATGRVVVATAVLQVVSMMQTASSQTLELDKATLLPGAAG
jgi:hypothetical protein